MVKIFEFPNPVNETASRVVAGGVVTMATATVALDQPWLLVPLTYGFAARVLTGPTLSPLGQIATRVIVPRLSGKPRLVPGPPKRLAQGVGLVISGTSLLAYFGFGRKRVAYSVLGALIVASGLEAFLGYCIACRLFPLLIKAGLVPEEACAACGDIWAHAEPLEAVG